MGFRKSEQPRIFVDENIPSFLKTKPENRIATPKAQPISTLPPVNIPPAQVPLNAPKATTKASTAATTDRRRQPLQIQPKFILTSVVITFLLNAALYSAFQSPLLYRQTLPMQVSSMHAIPSEPVASHTPVVSYRYSNNGMVETP